MPKSRTMDILQERLFDDIDKLQDLSPTQRDQILRYRAIFTLKLGKPHITNKEVARMLRKQYGITSVGQAYRDIAATEIMLGSVRSSEKQWVRYLVTETLKEALAMAVDQENVLAMIAAADKLGKYSRLDQEDQEPIPYEDIVPQPIEYVNDPGLLGRPMPAEGVKEYIEKVKRKYIDAKEIEYEEVKSGT